MLHTAFASALVAATLAAPPAPVARPAVAAAPITWTIDAAHSDLTFKIRHLMSKVSGTVTEWSGTIVADPAALGGGSVEISANMATINTRNERRDGHLKSPEFFDVAKFPTLTFKSTKVTAKGNDLEITGDLTMKGVTKPVVLKAEFLGTMGPAEPKKQKAGFHAVTKINRLDWGVTWNRAAEGGGLTLGDEVELEFNIEAVRN